jgi:cytochrome c oxidase cbb3-type subunit 3
MRQRWKLLVVSVAMLVLALLAIQGSSQREEAAMLRADPEEILSQPALRKVALAHGGTVYQAQCASCHGVNGAGDPVLGVPDLTAVRPLYGEGLVAEIEDIARHGIRSADKRGLNLASMPAYGTSRPYKNEPLPSLTPGQIEDLTQHVLALNGRETDPAAAKQGGVLYHGAAGCYDCHGNNGEGDSAIGAPSLTPGLWVFGNGSHDDIYKSLVAGRAGVSPAFGRVLSAAELRSVAAYVASLRKIISQQADAR